MRESNRSPGGNSNAPSPKRRVRMPADLVVVDGASLDDRRVTLEEDQLRRKIQRSLPVGAPETSRKNRLPQSRAQRYGPIVANFTKIVSATDFSEDSNLAVGYAEELARRFGAEIILLHVDQALPPVMVSPEIGPVMDVGAMTRIAEEQRVLAQRELDKIVNRMRDSGLKARSLLKVGSPFLEVIHAAHTEGADLIVMGTHGRTGIAHVLMGSVAERVVQKAHCPVLTIRHPDRKFQHPLDHK